MRKAIKNLIIVFAMCTVFILAASATFTDEGSIRNRDAVSYLTENGILSGYSDGTFRPGGNITRAEFAKMIFVMLKNTDDASGYINMAKELTDIGSHWANGYISALFNEGIVAGGNSGLFNPDSSITGFEMAKMLLAATGTNAETSGLTGTDWMKNTEMLANEKGFLTNYAMSLSDDATREYAALMIYNAITNGEKTASGYKFCAVTADKNNTISILDQDGVKRSYSAANTSLSPSVGDIYYFKTDGDKLILKELSSVTAKSIANMEGVQIYWGSDKLVTIDGGEYQTDENTVLFIKNNRQGLSDHYTYDFKVYKAHSLRNTYAGSAVSAAVIDKSSGGAVAKLLVCDMDTYDISKTSAAGIAYVTDEPIVTKTAGGQYLTSYPMFAGRDKELCLAGDSAPHLSTSLKGQFAKFTIDSQGFLKREPTLVPVSGLSLAYAKNTLVLGEITGYDRSKGRVQIKSSGDERVFLFADNYKIIDLNTVNNIGVDGGVVPMGNGKSNCVYYTDSDDRILYLFVDVKGQIQ